jgi:DNA-binding CsgD family transcriptional regulator
MLQKEYLSVLEAETRDELEHKVVRFTQELGFQTVTAMTVIDHVVGESEFICIDNGPLDYMQFAEDKDRAKQDPVMQHCKHKSVPLVWNQATYVAAGQVDKWEEQARFGYRHGIALALHMPGGRHFMLALDRDQPLPDDAAEVTRLVAAPHLFTVYAQEAAQRVMLPKVREGEAASLTKRELETLRWTMEGKTAWEVGRILGIAENTVIRHAQAATQKLGCTSKHHAVVKALRAGMIS